MIGWSFMGRFFLFCWYDDGWTFLDGEGLCGFFFPF
jgi:hypothetical protein